MNDPYQVYQTYLSAVGAHQNKEAVVANNIATIKNYQNGSKLGNYNEKIT